MTEQGVDTLSFLDASESVVQIFGKWGSPFSQDERSPWSDPFVLDLLSSTAFAAVKSDMNGNILVRL